MRVNTFQFFGKALFASLFVTLVFNVVNVAAFTVTYDAQGALFDNGQATNVVEYGSADTITSGEYKEPVLNNPTVADWYWSTDEEGKNELNLSEVASDITAYAQYRKVQWKFGYTGDVQSYIVPYEKRMLYEVWGAQGGDYINGDNVYPGGAGGYSRGYLTRNFDDQFYIVNGQKGMTGIGYAYNGGGPSTSSVAGSGGGATHIALETGLLSEFKEKKDKVVMVAGAGGGINKQPTNLLEREVTSQHQTGYGGDNSAGGGYWGNDGLSNYRGRGGDQENPGPKAFGNVGALRRNSDFGLGGGAENGSGGNEGGGGGAGWYGGSGAGWGIGGSGGGGSGYVGYSDLYLAKMYGLRVTESDVAGQITVSTTNYSEEPVSRYAKTGDGFTMVSINQARIVFKWGNQEDFKLRYWGDTVDDSGIDANIDGYTFLGWFIGDDEYDFSTPIEEDIVLTAKYEIATYNISYDISNGILSGPNPATYTVESDDITLNNPTAPDYYNFLGWSGTDLDGDENLTVTIPKGSIGDREYTANIKPTKYNISYELNGGSSSTGYPATYDYETPEIALANPVKEGHTFLGWSGTDLDGNENFDVIIPAQSHGDREYTANWSINQYTATFDVNGGSAIDSNIITSDYGVAFGPLPETHIDGYKFLGWFTEQDGGEEISASTTMPAEDHIYYAHWELITYTITYVMDGHINSDTNPTSFNVHSRDIVIADAEPKAYYYYFLGWTTNPDTEEDLTKDFTIPSGSTEDITLYAIFQQNPYTIEFDCENYCEFEPITKVGEEPIGELPTPEREGYIFLGWFIDDNKLEPTSTPRSSATAIARWEKIEVPNTGDSIIAFVAIFTISVFTLLFITKTKTQPAK